MREDKPKLRRTKEEELPDQSPEGLKDGGHIYPRCSNCQALLMDIWRTRPYEPQTWKVRASCPFCNDRSFVVEVKGGFHFGGYGRPCPDDPSADFPSTVVDHFEINSDTFDFTIKKASPDAKPYRN